MKDLHRNVIMHPDVSLDMEEAKALIGMAYSVVAAMLKEMPVDVPEQREFKLPHPEAFGVAHGGAGG